MKLTFIVLGMSLWAQTADAEPEFQLPPAMYFSTIDKSLLDALKQQQGFSELSEDLHGSPLRILVTHSFAMTRGGQAAGLASAFLAGGTLGILPMVTNQDLVVTYTVSSHGKTIGTFSYSKNFTKASNMYSSSGFYQMDKESLAWALTTAELFAADLPKNAQVQELIEDYRYYFPQSAQASGTK